MPQVLGAHSIEVVSERHCCGRGMGGSRVRKGEGAGEGAARGRAGYIPAPRGMAQHGRGSAHTAEVQCRAAPPLQCTVLLASLPHSPLCSTACRRCPCHTNYCPGRALTAECGRHALQRLAHARPRAQAAALRSISSPDARPRARSLQVAAMESRDGECGRRWPLCSRRHRSRRAASGSGAGARRRPASEPPGRARGAA